MVWMTNKAEFLERSTQIESSMAMVMMSSINPSIGYSFSLMSNDSFSACSSWYCPGYYYSSLISCMWGYWSSVVSHYFSLRRSFPRSIATSLTVVYSAGAGVVTKGKRSHIKERLSTMVIHFGVICMFTFLRKYGVSRSILPIRMLLYGHFIHRDTIMWSILRRQNP